MLSWAFYGGVAVASCLGLMLVAWVVRSRLRERRRARFVAQLSAQYRKARPALPVVVRESRPASEERLSGRKITVDELVTRLEVERLRRNELRDAIQNRPTDEWPTDILGGANPESKDDAGRR